MDPYAIRGGFYPVPTGPAPDTTGGRDPMQGGPAPPLGPAPPPEDPEQVRARAYATIAANPASEEAQAAREVLARLPKIHVGRQQPGSVDPEPDNTMLLAQYMRGMR
jgi:hypothetical protein